MTTIANHVSGTNSTLGSWLKVKETISLKFKWNKIKAEFGFYSEASVCMPHFYASTSESSWEYSTLFVTLNFILFISMVVTYVLVYKKASGMIISTFTKKDTKKGMQKKISRLFLTDFLCWIPVCVMAYLSVAGVSLPPGAYIASDGFLLPINSAMNPPHYSKLVGQYISLARKCVINNLLSICTSHLDDVTVVEERAEQIELEIVNPNRCTETCHAKKGGN